MLWVPAEVAILHWWIANQQWVAELYWLGRGFAPIIIEQIYIY